MTGPQSLPPAPLMVVLDTSVWISRLLTQDSNHVAARTWIDSHLLHSGSLVSPVLLLTEVAAAVSRRTASPARAHAAVSYLYDLPEMRLVPVDQHLVTLATDLAADLGLRSADALFVALARHLSLPLVTFDAEQLQKPNAIIRTIQP